MLATADDLTLYGYDVVTVAPLLVRADARVRGYLRRRALAQAVLAADGIATPELREHMCAIAARMAATSSSADKGDLLAGVRSQASGTESVTWGAEAYAGVSDLTTGEKSRLDEMFPVLPRTASVVEETT